MLDSIRIFWTAAALFCLIFQGACSPPIPHGKRSGEDDSPLIFRFRIPGDPPSLDPIHSADLISQTVVNNIFDPLIRLDPATGELVPAIARKWEIEEGGLAFRFFLRKDVRFHNGRRLVAEDVRYSFERLLAPASASERPWILLPLKGARAFNNSEAARVEGIQTEGDSVVVLRLQEPYAPFLVQLSMVGASICPREEVERDGESAYGQQPIGSGPFRFVEWQHDNRIVVERFDNYTVGPRSSLERVIFDVVPNISMALEKYRAGELDLLDQLPPGQIELVRKRLGEELHIWPGLSVR